MTDELKPVLKWVGGKRQLLHEILPRIENRRVYIEPFVGGGAVWLALRPEHAIIADANAELVNVYECVRDECNELIELLREHEASDSSEHFYETRALDRDAVVFAGLSPVERAARIIYLNKTCYNGLYRVNAAGQLNVPYGRYKHPNIVNEKGLRSLSAYLAGDITLVCSDFAETMALADEDSFVYLDPPYVPISNTAAFTGYGADGFPMSEQERLRDECLALRDRGAAFLESNSDCAIVRELYRDFKIESVIARRAVNSKGDRRGAVGEVLISG